MKRIHRLIAMVCALVAIALVVAPTTSFAADGDTAAGTHTLNIYSKTSGHEYQAYQVFSGKYSKDKDNLSDIAWGDGVDSDALLAELQVVDAYENCTDAASVANVLSGFKGNSSELDAFADIVAKHIKGDPITSVYVAGTTYNYMISGLADGYYFVKDNTDKEVSDAYTKFILQMVTDKSVDAKADAPSIDKKIVENNTTVSTNNAAIGDNVNFAVQSRVPKMDGYDSYTFTVTDTLSKGLTFNNDVVITIGDPNNGGKTLTKDTDFTVKTEAKDEGTIITIDFLNFIQYKNDATRIIEMRYSAKLNENANIGSTGNPNTVTLTYSNDPNSTTTHTTPPTDTVTYTTGITLTKVDGSDKTTTLTGAKFKLSKENDTSFAAIEKEVDENGVLNFNGLKAGTYLIEEIVAPDGYNLLTEPIKIVINWIEPSNPVTSESKCTWSIGTETTSGVTVNNDGIFAITVENFKGPQLPSTGGMGTTVLYVVGTALVLGAGVALVVKRRSETQSK